MPGTVRIRRTGARVLLAACVVCSCGSDRPQERRPPAQERAASSDASASRDSIRTFWRHYRTAADLRHDGEWDAAAQAYEAALAYDADHEDTLYGLGNVMFELGRYAEAEAAWTRLAEASAFSGRAHMQLGALYSCGADGAPFDLDRARRAFQAAKRINAEQIGPILKLGEAALLAGNLDSAAAAFQTVLRTHPASERALMLAAYAHWRNGDREAACGELTRLVALREDARDDGLPAGEGATRSGGGPMLAEGALKKTLFAPYFSAVRRIEPGSSQEATVRAFELADTLTAHLPVN